MMEYDPTVNLWQISGTSLPRATLRGSGYFTFLSVRFPEQATTASRPDEFAE